MISFANDAGHAILHRVLADLITGELRAHRGRAPDLPTRLWSHGLVLGGDALPIDSLEMLAISGAVNEMFHLHTGGREDMLLARRRLSDWVGEVARAWPGRDNRRITFKTSGSTGAPKPVTHDLDTLLAEVHVHRTHLRPGRILSAVPGHHIYGFIFTGLLPRFAEIDVVDVRDDLNALARAAPDDLIVATPDVWDYVARGFGTLPPATGVSSTAPLSSTTARRLVERGLDRVVEIYGATEVGAIGWRDDPDAAFRLFPGWHVQAGPMPGSDVPRPLTLVGRAGTPVLAPNMVTRPDAGSLCVGPRHDGAVQIGGYNVDLADLRAHLEAHPQIAEVRVTAVPTGNDGALRLEAAVTPTPAAEQAGIALADWPAKVATWLTGRVDPRAQPTAVYLAPPSPTRATRADGGSEGAS